MQVLGRNGVMRLGKRLTDATTNYNSRTYGSTTEVGKIPLSTRRTYEKIQWRTT